MPIKPENRKLYPKNWREIRQRILKRAGNRCEFCGAPNHAYGFRDPDGVFHEWDPFEGGPTRLSELPAVRWVRIVLTIAHLDHDPTNNDPENLKALCQQCHNRWDAEHRKKNRLKTLAEKKALEAREKGLEPLFGSDA